MTISKRLASAIGMMGAANENEARSAFSTATRLLAEAGMTWRDVADRLSPGQAPIATANPFEDIFAGFASKAWGRPAEAPRPAARSYAEIVQGAEIPTEIVGTIRIDDERAWRGGDMLIVSVRDEFRHYGPMVVFSKDLHGDVREAAASGRRVMARIRQSGREGLNPIVSSLTVLGS